MSRLAKKPIPVPANTSIRVEGNKLVVKGPLGELARVIRPTIAVEIGSGVVTLTPKTMNNETRALWGTYASLIKSMIAGVQTPFSKKLLIEGIGFKADAKGSEIVLSLGFSHPVKVAIPSGIKVVTEKGAITVSGIDKEMVGRFASEIRALKKPEPYKGKGIRYENEHIKMKQGKKATATAG